MGFTNAGKQEVLDWIIGAGSAVAPTHIGVGTGSTSFNVTQTALDSEVYPDTVDRNAISATSRTGRQGTLEIVLLSTDLGTDPTITETGLFNAATSGDMFTRNVFNGVSKDGNTEVQIIEVLRFI